MKYLEYAIYVLDKVTPVNQKEKDEIKQAIIYLKEANRKKGNVASAYDYTEVDKSIIQAISNGAVKRCVIYNHCKDVLNKTSQERNLLPYKILDLRLASLKKRKKIKRLNREYGWVIHEYAT